MDNLKLVINEGPVFRLRTNAGPAEQLSLGHAIPVYENSYNALTNKPQIDGVTLIGNIPFSDLLGGLLVLDGGDADFVAGEGGGS